MSHSTVRRTIDSGHVAGIGVVVLVFVVVAALALSLRPTTRETVVLPPVAFPDPGEMPAAAVVVALRESTGFSLFGYAIGDVTRRVTVQFYAPAGCDERLATGDRWPTPFAECTGRVSSEGTISGRGIAATGESIVAVDVDVSESCFASISHGDPWPPVGEACF